VTLALESTDIAPALLQTLDLRTDARGVAKFEIALPPSLVGREQDGGQARVTFTASVRDPAGELQNKSENRVVAASPIRIEVIPEAGSLVKGLPNTIHVLTTSIDGRPVRTRIAISGLNHQLHTNDLGVTSFEFNPTADGQNWTVSAKDERGQTGRRQVEFRCGEIDAGYLVRTDKAVYEGSESIHVLALGAGVEPIFIDLIKDGQTILSESIEMAQGRGERPIDLPPELFGTVVFHAYRYGPAGLPVRQSRIIYIRPANALAIKVTTDRSEYRPGERASLTFALTDAKGSPAPGAISLAAVDEAVFGVLDRRPGLEQTFFTLERELLKPIYEIKDWSPDLAEASELVRGTQPADRTRLEQALFARAARGPALHEIAGPLGDDPDVAPALRVLDRPDWEQLAERANLPAELITQLHKAAGPHSLVFSSYSEKLRSVEAFQRAASSNLAKAWFILGLAAFAGLLAWAIANVRRSTIIEVFTIVAILGVLTGLLLPATQSAREAARRSQAINNLKEIGLAVAPRGETRGPEAVRVRRNFPETLLWRPELITDDQGRARLDLELADSITTWRCAVGAVMADGRLGAAQAAIRVFQPFFVDIELPTALTRGDEIGIPVVVSNYLDNPQTVTVALAEAPWFDRLETAAERTITLAANEVRSVHFRVRANLVGHQEIEVTARAAEGGVADAVRRAIEVVPDGLRIERVASGTLTRPVEFDLAVPDDAIPGSTRAIAKIYPSSFSQLVEGLDGIFQRPYGCFEQTSSTTYPNVLALDYLRRTGKSLPQVEAKARQYIHLGYQRLLGFEVTGGGFDWFGHPPANRTLTAYGLMEFQDMARVHDVDPSIISRTRTWLLEQQRADGSWDSEGHSFHGSPADRMSGQALARLATTAYIAWSAFSGQPASTNSQAAQAYLQSNAGVAKNDPYVLALVASALLAIDPEGVAAREHLDRLESLRQMSSDGKLVWWGPIGSPMESARTLFFAAGECRQIETTALAAQALLSARRSPDVVRSSLAWLVAHKDAHGTWGSTQATILALKALVAGTGKPLGGDTPRRFAVILDGETVHDLTIPAVQSDVVQQFDLSSRIAAAPGTHRLTIEDRSGTDASYQIVFRYHEPDPAGRALAGAASNAGPLAIHIDYDRTTIAVDDVVSAVASVVNNRPDPAPMVILDLPIPAGFAIASDDLGGLVKAGSIAKFQLSARSAIVYLRDLEPDKPLTLRYRLRATMPVKLMVPAARAYEYYNPEREGTSQPVRLTVTAKS
jgi:alpha-2-macroglobulin-like protein